MILPSWTWLILLVINIACIVHVIKRDREFWWIFIILFFQVFGALIYFVVEILPDLRRGELGKDISEVGSKLRRPSTRISQLKKEIESTPTIEKKVELAEAYGQAGQWENACACYQECVSGPFDDDPYILYGFAYAHFQTGEYAEAETALDKIDRTDSKDRRDERLLLRLRIYEMTGRESEALERYPSLLETFTGEEAPYRYACLLKKMGRIEEATKRFESIVVDSKNHSKLYRRQNQKWIAAAKRELD